MDEDERETAEREAAEQRAREEQVRADARRARRARELGEHEENAAFVRQLGFEELLDD